MTDEFWEQLREHLDMKFDIEDLEMVTIEDYQAFDNGGFEVIVFQDAIETSRRGYQVHYFWITKHMGYKRETVTAGIMRKKRTAGEVLTLYINTVIDFTITYDDNGYVKLLERGEYLEK